MNWNVSLTPTVPGVALHGVQENTSITVLDMAGCPASMTLISKHTLVHVNHKVMVHRVSFRPGPKVAVKA